LVETLDLSARTLNCLKRAGINRVGEVLEKPKADLLKIRNFGQKSLDELYDRLAENDLLPKSASPDSEDDSDGESADDEPAAELVGAAESGDDGVEDGQEEQQ
jgi:DNA-directed RNA polymerase subunit alpha